MSKQAIEERLSRPTAQCLLAVRRRAVQCVVCAQAGSIPWLQAFTGVRLEDGSTISLPASLKDVWRGCGGSGPEAALKRRVRWDLLGGSMAGPYIQDGPMPETQSPLRAQPMAPGSLWIGDLGYFALIWVTQLVKEGVYFLMSFKDSVTVWDGAGHRVEVLDLLPTKPGETVDVPVTLGARKPLPARLIARKMPASVVERGREQLKEYARKHKKSVNPRQWEMLPWTIVLSNVPLRLLSGAEALLLLGARWQMERLWKLWKDQGKLDEWQTANPERILGELYAKLVGMIVQHWVLLLSCWQDPHRSLVGAVQVIRQPVPTLVHGLTGRLPLGKVIGCIIDALAGGCSIPKRTHRLTTSHCLLEPLDDSFP